MRFANAATITLSLITGALGLCSSLKATRTKQELGRSALVKDERVWKTSLGVADRSHGTTVMNGELRRARIVPFLESH